jgi:hypothetical protein
MGGAISRNVANICIRFGERCHKQTLINFRILDNCFTYFMKFLYVHIITVEEFNTTTVSLFQTVISQAHRITKSV